MHVSSYWEEQLGRNGLSYYEDAFLDVLSRDFAGDQYLVEDFQESVFKNEICLRIVDKVQGYNRFEGVIEDGIFVYPGTLAMWASSLPGVITNQGRPRLKIGEGASTT
jgi:hypothetical protein